jgi:hypothetical protein
MKLGYEKPEKVIKNLNEGAKNSKSTGSFCIGHTYSIIQDYSGRDNIRAIDFRC